MRLRHAILGPGGVGGLIAAVLADSGDTVMLIVRPGTESLYPREISLESPFRNLQARVSISAEPQEPCDVLWVTVKATQLHPALESIPEKWRVSAVVPLLNGIDHMDLLRNRFGRGPVIPATISVESERVAAGKIVQRSPFVRFATAASGTERLAHTLMIFRRFGFECAISDDEPTLLWSKLAFLAPFALATTAARSTIGEVLCDPAKAARLEACVRETCAVASRSGARVDANSVISKIKGLPPSMRSSMERDIANGNPLELDAIGGPILRGAQRYGIPLDATREFVGALAQPYRA